MEKERALNVLRAIVLGSCLENAIKTELLTFIDKEYGFMMIDIENTKTHELKTLPQYFIDVLEENKTFEVRFNDRNFKVGDILCLREHSPEEGYTGRILMKQISYILGDCNYCKEGYVILGLKAGDVGCIVYG